MNYEDISGYAREAIGNLAAMGLVKGSEGSINPKGTATRAEAAQLLYNVMVFVTQ